ncbi:hypothetical protein [Frankia tisae]|uniref:hypothetical protein n=1 Tax=Frankia tisae TaxID=2950104 RepID=UPI0021BFD5E8|nr:hypothetical protein [Frankia tisae]
MATSTDAETLLSDLDQAPDGEAAARAEGLLARLIAARAERTRARLDAEANAERLAELKALRAEIIAHAGDADEIISRLDTAVDSVAELVRVVAARRELHIRWRADLARLDVPEGIGGAVRDAGLGRSSGFNGAVAVDRRQVHFLTPGDLLGALLHQLARKVPPGMDLTPATLDYNRQFAENPAGYIRAVLASDLGETS